MRQFQCIPTTYVTENKENCFFKILLYQVSCPLLLILLNIPNCPLVSKYLSLYCKLFIFAWQLYLQISVHELPLCKLGSCVVVIIPSLLYADNEDFDQTELMQGLIWVSHIWCFFLMSRFITTWYSFLISFIKYEAENVLSHGWELTPGRPSTRIML